MIVIFYWMNDFYLYEFILFGLYFMEKLTVIYLYLYSILNYFPISENSLSVFAANLILEFAFEL